MDPISVVFLGLIPAGIVALVTYYMVKAFIEKDHQASYAKLKMNSNGITLPLRLQAYERMAIFLERLAPNSLILRLNNGELSALELQAFMINEIRHEYNHNVAQQIYMSEQAWQAVVQAKEEMIALINNSSDGLSKDAPAIELAKAIFQNVLNSENDIVTARLRVVKDEVRDLI